MGQIDMGTLYDVNKNIMKQSKKLEEGVINSKIEIVKNFITKTNNKYYMLLCNERKDYTVFNLSQIEDAKETSEILINECLPNRGEIRGIDLTENHDAIEIWLYIEEDAFVYYFFPYNLGIIEVGGE